MTTSRSTVGCGASEFDACTLECGLYEASDMLLGDQLCDKSCTVEWLDVSTCEAAEVEKPQTIKGIERA